MNVIKARQLMNAMGSVTGEGEIIAPMSDNEMFVRVWTRIVTGIVVIVMSVLVWKTWDVKMQNDVARYAIDRGAWTCGYDAKGTAVCTPRPEIAKK